MTISATGLVMISLSLESMVYGVYTVIILAVVYLLVAHKISDVHKVLACVCILMFFMATLQLAFQLQAKIMGPAIPQVILQVQNVVVVLLFLMGDSIFIWRMWMVWNRRHVMVVLPVLMLLGSTCLGLYRVSNFGATLVITTAVISLNTANTILCTSLIVGRVLYLQSQVQSVSGNPYKKAVILVIESGAVYAAIQTAFLITVRTKSPATSLVASLQVPLIGMLPAAILLVVHYDLSVSSDSSGMRRTTGNEKSTFRAAPPTSSMGSDGMPVTTFSVKNATRELTRMEFGTGSSKDPTEADYEMHGLSKAQV